ncbi:MAG: MarR family winged helix-turn-helix transcriptional regulator [Huintestinicola sp.]
MHKNAMDILTGSKCLSQQVDNMINSMLSDRSLTASQSRILIYVIIHEGEHIYPADIHRALDISKPTVTGLLKKLKHNGYLTIDGSASDERHKIITATEKAYQHKAEIDRCFEKICACIFKDFTDSDFEQLAAFHQRMKQNIKDAGR